MKLKIDNKGFTLIELIVVLVIASIVGTMMYQFIRTSTIKESDPIFSLNKSLKLHEIMENITSDYLEYYTLDLVSLQEKIGGIQVHTNDYGTYGVIENKFIKFVSNTEAAAPPGDPETGKLLKVTLQDSGGSGENLTVLFSKQ